MGSRCSVLGAHLQSCVSTLEYPLPPAFSQVVNLSQDLTAAFSKKRNKMSELLWSHCVSLQITYKMSFPWTGEQGAPNSLSASSWPRSFPCHSALFYFPQQYAPTGYSSSIQCHLGVCLFKSSCCLPQTCGHTCFQQTLFYPHCLMPSA